MVESSKIKSYKKFDGAKRNVFKQFGLKHGENTLSIPNNLNNCVKKDTLTV